MNNNREVSYKVWSNSYKSVVSEESEEKVRKKHESRALYYALVGSDESPYCHLSINNRFIIVTFIDYHKRKYLTYEFTEISPGKLFLKQAQFWEYEGDSDKMLWSTTYRFNSEGELGIRKTNLVMREQEDLISKERVDVSTNYEDYPEFGKYQALIKKERNLSNPCN